MVECAAVNGRIGASEDGRLDPCIGLTFGILCGGVSTSLGPTFVSVEESSFLAVLTTSLDLLHEFKGTGSSVFVITNNI